MVPLSPEYQPGVLQNKSRLSEVARESHPMVMLANRVEMIMNHLLGSIFEYLGRAYFLSLVRGIYKNRARDGRVMVTE